VRILEKAQWDMLHQTCIFASGAMCGSRSAFWGIQGMKRRCTIFHARVVLVRIT
jgi:hypothetical protein